MCLVFFFFFNFQQSCMLIHIIQNTDMLPFWFTSAFSLCRYDSYGRLTNVTYPTGQVSSYRTDADSSVRIQTEGSNKEDITVTTNLSASGTFYTLMQGECLLLLLISRTCDIKGVSVPCQKTLLTEKMNPELVCSVRRPRNIKLNIVKENCINLKSSA